MAGNGNGEKWIKWYPRAILSSYDYRKMTLEEKGLYCHLLFLLAETDDGEIIFDEKLLAGELGINSRKVRAVFARISHKFFVRICDENVVKISNLRMKNTVTERAEKSKKLSDNGRLGAMATNSQRSANAEAIAKQLPINKSKNKKEKEIREDKDFLSLFPDGNNDRPQQGQRTPEAAVRNKPEKGAPPCPQEEIIKLYHEILPMCPRVRSWNATRQAHLKARWKDTIRTRDGTGVISISNLEWWERFFRYIRDGCPFLTGGVPGRDGKAPFVADLEWMIEPSHFARIAEGKYEEVG